MSEIAKNFGQKFCYPKGAGLEETLGKLCGFLNKFYFQDAGNGVIISTAYLYCSLWKFCACGMGEVVRYQVLIKGIFGIELFFFAKRKNFY
jgi:hypothetical protein